MSKFKHTPGPWRQDNDVCIFDNDGKSICNLWYSQTEEDMPNAINNALVISTAPEMLEALILAYKSNMEACDDIGGCPYECNNNHCEICIHSKNEIQLKTIIEKATGMPIEEVMKDE